MSASHLGHALGHWLSQNRPRHLYRCLHPLHRWRLLHGLSQRCLRYQNEPVSQSREIFLSQNDPVSQSREIFLPQNEPVSQSREIFLPHRTGLNKSSILEKTSTFSFSPARIFISSDLTRIVFFVQSVLVYFVRQQPRFVFPIPKI